MGGKRNKIRYQSKPKDKVIILLTGKAYLQYRDDEIMMQAQKGDVLLRPVNDALNSNRLGEYEITGFAGYFKAEVCDGKDWCPVIMSGLFPQREHYFSKSERSIDTAALCTELLAAKQGQALVRTYREHYEVDED